MKKILWKGETCAIPKFGMATAGELTNLLPDSLADDFIRQGLAEDIKKAKPKSISNEEAK